MEVRKEHGESRYIISRTAPRSMTVLIPKVNRNEQTIFKSLKPDKFGSCECVRSQLSVRLPAPVAFGVNVETGVASPSSRKGQKEAHGRQVIVGRVGVGTPHFVGQAWGQSTTPPVASTISARSAARDAQGACRTCSSVAKAAGTAD